MRLPSSSSAAVATACTRAQSRPARAFTLVEVVLALGVVAFVIVALVAMLPIGLMSVRDAERETLAASLLNSIVEDLRNSPTSTSTLLLQMSPHPLQAAGTTDSVFYFSENQLLVARPEALCKVLIRTENAVLGRSRGVLIRITWPAQADDGREVGAVESYSYFPARP